MRALLIFLGLILGSIPTVLFSSIESKAATQKIVEAPTGCHVEAYVIDPDPKGLNVRIGPGADYGVITRLLSQNDTMVSIKGARGNWVLIDEAFELDPVEKTE